MNIYIKSGCAALLLSLALTAPSLAQNTHTRSVVYGCSTGTKGGKCLNPVVWGAAMRASQLLVYNASRTTLPVAPNKDATVDDVLLPTGPLYPQHGLNGTTGFSGGGSPNFIYGRWN